MTVTEEHMAEAREIAEWAERCAANLQAIAAGGAFTLQGPHPCECNAFAQDLEQRVLAALARRDATAEAEIAQTVRKFNCDNPQQFWDRIGKLNTRAEVAEATVARLTAELADLRRESELRDKVVEAAQSMPAFHRTVALNGALAAFAQSKDAPGGSSHD